MAYPPLRPLLILLLSALGVACQPKIGDECQTSVDCSQGGERLCDITQPGGYCTVFNCEPDSCPEEAACVAFGANLSTVNACVDGNGLSRIHRSFCMVTCGSDRDCRGDYECVDITSQAWRNALRIDTDRSSKVCLAKFSFESLPADGEAGVCSGPSGTGGMSSSGGSSSGGSSSGGNSSQGGSSQGEAGSAGAGGSGS